MSLCYDFQKWTIVSMASVTITLTIGLVSLVYGQEAWNTTQLIQKNGSDIYDSDYCQKNLNATAQRVCGKSDLLCQEHKGQNEFWDDFRKTFPEELNKIR